MSQVSRVSLTVGAIAAVVVLASGQAYTQAGDQPTNDAPNPYQTRQRLGQAARRTDLGIDERRRDR